LEQAPETGCVPKHVNTRTRARLVGSLSVSLASLCLCLNGAFSAPASGNYARQDDAASKLTEGAFTPPPPAFALFCERFSHQCLRSGAAETIRLDPFRWSQLVKVNATVNRRIKPKPEPAGVDVWTINAHEGDCDAFAIEKRKELLDLGWPSASLSLTVAYARESEAHLVLTVRTDRGEYLLDNLRNAVVGVNDVSYRFVMRQSAIHPRLWVMISDAQTLKASTVALSH